MSQKALQTSSKILIAGIALLSLTASEMARAATEQEQICDALVALADSEYTTLKDEADEATAKGSNARNLYDNALKFFDGLKTEELLYIKAAKQQQLTTARLAAVLGNSANKINVELSRKTAALEKKRKADRSKVIVNGKVLDERIKPSYVGVIDDGKTAWLISCGPRDYSNDQVCFAADLLQTEKIKTEMLQQMEKLAEMPKLGRKAFIRERLPNECQMTPIWAANSKVQDNPEPKILTMDSASPTAKPVEKFSHWWAN